MVFISPNIPERRCVEISGKLLTVDEFRARLRIGRNKAYSYIKQKQVPVLVIGGQYRVPEDALNKWIAENTYCETVAGKEG